MSWSRSVALGWRLRYALSLVLCFSLPLIYSWLVVWRWKLGMVDPFTVVAVWAFTSALLRVRLRPTDPHPNLPASVPESEFGKSFEYLRRVAERASDTAGAFRYELELVADFSPVVPDVYSVYRNGKYHVRLPMSVAEKLLGKELELMLRHSFTVARAAWSSRLWIDLSSALWAGVFAATMAALGARAQNIRELTWMTVVGTLWSIPFGLFAILSERAVMRALRVFYDFVLSESRSERLLLFSALDKLRIELSPSQWWWVASYGNDRFTPDGRLKILRQAFAT